MDRQHEKKAGDYVWGKLFNEAHHELVVWMLMAGISQAKMDTFFKSRLVSI